MHIFHEKMAWLQLPVSEQLPEEDLHAMFDISGVSLLALSWLHEYIHACLHPLPFKYYSETYLIRTIELCTQLISQIGKTVQHNLTYVGKKIVFFFQRIMCVVHF